MALLFLAGMVALYIAAYAYGRTAADRSYDRLLAGSARSIAETLVTTANGFDVDIPYSAFDLLSAAPDDRIFYRVYEQTGRTVTGYADLPPSPTKPRASAYRADAAFFTADYRGEPVRFVTVGRRLAMDGVKSQPRLIWVEVGQTRRAHESLVTDLVFRSLLPIVLMTVVALLVVWLGIGHALRPLKTIGDELTARAPTDLDAIKAPVPIEVAPLISAINGFMARLASNIQTLRGFVAEAAHQLRTPIASLRAQAQVADRTSLEDMDRSLDAVERNAARLTRLVNQMLSDATMSHRSDIRHSAAFDLGDMLREVVHEAAAFGGASDCTLACPEGDTPMIGDPLMLSEGLRNIIDNGRTHGTGPVEVELRVEGDRYIVDIADRGPGISADSKAIVFDRFVRGTGGSKGAGLGLAIARQAVESHGGAIDLLDRDGGGLNVRVTLLRGRS